MNIHFTSVLQRFSYGKRINAVRDWLVLLTLAGIVLAGIVLWNVWAFNAVASGRTIGAAPAGAPAVFNASTLTTIKSVFAARAAEDDKYTTGAYTFADPSQ
ncbi:MAG TPA: hypothetical protein VMV50_02220 [Candidatus Paceibacterota bacterium]|nr:hypothetical protein [Candidatus Paceibacterota bacterium]